MTSTETAVSLMRMALALLEREKLADAASHLRGAIELADPPATLTATRLAVSDAPMRAQRC